ncbi:MAG: fluoride efflux transporter CrcB [Victivallales bacterium]
MKQVILFSLYVGAGGLIGAVTRYLCTLFFLKYSFSFPAGTFLSNIVGCLVIGIIIQIATGSELLSPETRLFLATGFCGGLTTMSSFIYETSQFISDGEYFHASSYFFLTLTISFAAFVSGCIIVKLIMRYGGQYGT